MTAKARSGHDGFLPGLAWRNWAKKHLRLPYLASFPEVEVFFCLKKVGKLIFKNMRKLKNMRCKTARRLIKQR